MNDLQIFSNPEFGQVRTVELDGRIRPKKCVSMMTVKTSGGFWLPSLNMR